MLTEKEHYRIELLLVHQNLSAAEIVNSLSLKPRIQKSVGQDHEKVTFIAAPLQEGHSKGECQNALKEISAFIEDHKWFWDNFSEEQGSLEIVVHQAISPGQNAGYRCVDLFLSAAFLKQLADSQIGFRIIGWEGKF